MKIFNINLMLVLLWRNAVSENCTTPLGMASHCISLRNCTELYSNIQMAIPSEVISFLRRSHCGFEGKMMMVCCGPLPSQSIVNTPRPTDEDPVNSTDSSFFPRNKCGIDNGNRIWGGEVADLDEFTWMALLGYKKSNNSSLKYVCAGVLINARYILSAAHCVVDEIERAVGKLTVARLGEYHTDNATDCVMNICADPVQDVPVQSAYAHPGYSDLNRNKKDDICVIRLAKRVTFTFYIQPICMVDVTQPLNSGDLVTVAGWGSTSDGFKSKTKQKLEVAIFNKTNCVKKYFGLGVTLTDNQICAGGVQNKDACKGDSGGPLMRLTDSGVWEAVGVVSFGYGCGRNGWPGIYSSVAGYIDWIKTTMRDSNV